MDLSVGDASAKAYGLRDLGLKRQEVIISKGPLRLNVRRKGQFALSRELVEPIAIERKGDLQPLGQRAI
jgi:hypothetical protein